MDIDKILTDSLIPFFYCGFIIGSFYISKYFTLNQFIKKDQWLKWHDWVVIPIFTLIQSVVIASAVQALVYEQQGILPAIYSSIVLPAVIACIYHMRKHQDAVYEQTRDLLVKDGSLPPREK